MHFDENDRRDECPEVPPDITGAKIGFAIIFVISLLIAGALALYTFCPFTFEKVRTAIFG